MHASHNGSSTIPFAVRNGEMIDVTQLASNEVGLKCKCFCKACGKELVAKLAERKRRKHFAHHATENAATNCSGAIETSVHEMAKQIVQRTLRLMLPDSGEVFSIRSRHASEQFADLPSGPWLFPAKLAEFTSVVDEQNVIFPSDQVVRPDLICNDTLTCPPETGVE